MAKKDKQPKEKKSDKAGKFLNASDAKKAYEKISDDMDWGQDMTHEESVSHHKAINRSC